MKPCAHARFRLVAAQRLAPEEYRAEVVICVDCAAFCLRGEMGWHSKGSLKANIGKFDEHSYHEGDRIDMLSGVETGSDAWWRLMGSEAA